MFGIANEPSEPARYIPFLVFRWFDLVVTVAAGILIVYVVFVANLIPYLQSSPPPTTSPPQKQTNPTAVPAPSRQEPNSNQFQQQQQQTQMKQ
jgi:hypothetical protein